MSNGTKSEWHSVTLNRYATSYMLHLKYFKEYDVAVTLRSGYKESNLSECKMWNFKTVRGNVTLYCDFKYGTH